MLRGLSSRCTLVNQCAGTPHAWTLVSFLVIGFTAAYPADELFFFSIALALLGSGSSVDRSGTYVNVELCFGALPVQPFDRLTVAMRSALVVAC